MKRLLVCLVIAVCAGLPDLAHALTCPNRPAGSATLATVRFNTTDGEGQMWDLYPGAGTITTIPGSEGSVSASILSPGASQGGQQVIWPKPGNQQPLNNIYVCFRWKMNADFVGIREGNKLFFQAAQDWTYGKPGINGVFYINKNSSAYPYPFFHLIFSHNTGGTDPAIYMDNSHACTADLGLGCEPNVTSTTIVPDQWITVESYIVASTCNTCRNATVKWWINGVLNGNYTNLNYGHGIVNQFQINHTWDGATGKQCGPPTNPSNPNGRDCRYPQIHYFDELIIASVGGLTPPPSPPPLIDNPPGAPGLVSGFTATVGGVQ